MEKVVLILVIFLVCGFGLFLYHYKWQVLYRNLGIDKVRDAVEEALQEEQLAEQCKLAKMTYPLHIKYLLPMIFLVLFFVELAGIQYLPQTGLPDKTPVVIVAFAVSIPFILVLLVLMKESKHVKTRFVLSLVFALIMELVAVGSISRFIDGYYFESTIGFKRLGNFALTIVIFIGAMYTAYTNWMNIYAEKQKTRM